MRDVNVRRERRLRNATSCLVVGRALCDVDCQVRRARLLGRFEPFDDAKRAVVDRVVPLGFFEQGKPDIELVLLDLLTEEVISSRCHGFTSMQVPLRAKLGFAEFEMVRFVRRCGLDDSS